MGKGTDWGILNDAFFKNQSAAMRWTLGDPGRASLRARYRALLGPPGRASWRAFETRASARLQAPGLFFFAVSSELGSAELGYHMQS
jgi:hypothetical protein